MIHPGTFESIKVSDCVLIYTVLPQGDMVTRSWAPGLSVAKTVNSCAYPYTPLEGVGREGGKSQDATFDP